MNKTYISSALILLGTSSFAADLFVDNFDIDSTASWTVNKSTGANANDANSSALFFFDYSTVGIPSAPNTTGGTTRGLRMDANVAGSIFSGLSVSPTSQTFSGDYKLSADVWWNFIGPAPVGGSGSTQAGGLGIGTAGATAQWAAAAQDSVWFACTTDGNSSVDWRAYSSAAPTGYPDASPIFVATGAGNRNNSHAYYSGFGLQTPPAAQTTLFPTQTGTTVVGSVGFSWHNLVVEKIGNNIKWTVDGTTIANVDATTVTLGGSNILLNYFDTNTGSSTTLHGMTFILFDNVKVQSIITNQILGPSGYTITQGMNFGGTLASLQISDNDKVFVLCDEIDSTGQIEFTATATLPSITSYALKMEASASRTDLSQFLAAYNYSTNTYTTVNFSTSTLIDSVVTGTITVNPNDYLGTGGALLSRVTWIPQADLDAADGWSQSVDQLQWTLVP